MIITIEPAATYEPEFNEAEYSISDLPHSLPGGLDLGLYDPSLSISVLDLDNGQTIDFNTAGKTPIHRN